MKLILWLIVAAVGVYLLPMNVLMVIGLFWVLGEIAGPPTSSNE